MTRDRVARLELAGEVLWLLPERVAYWERRRTLLLADAHWGKAAAFRAGGIPVPGGTTGEGLRRLTGAVGESGATRILFLGDFLHARSGRAPATLATLQRWRERHPELELILIRGNHDRAAGDPPPELGIECVNEPVEEGPFLLAHHPAAGDGLYGLAGHVHPVVRLIGPARQRQRLTCFWFGPHGGILPAFGDFTGGGDIRPAPGDRVFVVAGGKVVEVSG
ncbi:MAG TPA: ligase-associated DNA damage response endonuclease PdeM [Longimicrobiaceae bacterium]